MRHISATLTVSLTLAITGTTYAQSQTIAPTSVSTLSTQLNGSGFHALKPRPSKKTRLDYTVWDELLKDSVFYTGPSLRQRASKPNPTAGSRVVFGHTSPFRLEGNKVMFEGMSDEFKTLLADYAKDLVEIGNSVDIPSLPRNEQLAYWFNLHNVLAIKAVADNYPMTSPSRQRGPDGLPFHDSKRVTINGIPLSLRNIRENIVYANWSDPLVIYGFFHGDLGSPSMQRKAFTGSNLQDTLRFSGTEFANSLRGIQTNGQQARVSKHYQDAAPYFFPSFEDGLRTHLATLLNEDVKAELAEADKPIKVAQYEDHVADMTKGMNDRIQLSNVQTLSDLGQQPISGIMARSITEHAVKMERVRERGLFGTVTIEDIQTPDPDAVFGELRGPSTIRLGPLATGEATED